MQAVILAAGKGTRMQPLTYEIPKPMVRLKGKPVLEYTLECLPEKVDEAVIVVNYLGRQIVDYFGDKFGRRKITYVKQEVLNGTGGAVHSCKSVLKDQFLVLNGDDLYHCEDLDKLINSHLAILVRKLIEPLETAQVKTNGEGNLVDIVERMRVKSGGVANTGAGFLDRRFFDYPLVEIGNGEYGLPQTVVQMAKDHPVKIVEATRWQPVGRLEELKRAEELLEEFLKAE